ncbi:MAG: tol-pal system protein YbgF [Ideonella sp.]|jgi:tol-pal system protein YbgF|nr:tol-pal system protein YbgF [Ideonella sp.]
MTFRLARGTVPRWWLAGTAALLVGGAQAGLLEDDEARKAILDLRARVQGNDDSTKARLTELSNVNAQLLEQLQQLRRSVLELNAQLETNRAEMAKMRGTEEQLSRDVTELQRKQKDAVQGVEDRLKKLEPQTVTVDGKEFKVDPDEHRAFDDAMATLRAGEFSKATAQLVTFLKRYPNTGYEPSARFWLGNAQYGKKDYRDAITTFRALVSDTPDHPRAPEAMLSVAYCQIEMKDAKGARRTLDELIKAYPSSEAAAAAKDRVASLKG